jgi:hypothetical protein
MIHRVSHFALELIKIELPFALSAPKVGDCVCATKRNYNLPCQHLLPDQIIPIDGSMIDRRWFLDEKGNIKNGKKNIFLTYCIFLTNSLIS